MSLKYKTEDAMKTVLEDGGIGTMTAYTSQNAQTTTVSLPAVVVEAQASDQITVRTLQENRRLVVSIHSTAQKKTTEDPASNHRDNVDLIAATLKVTGPTMKALLNAAGSGFHCLFARYDGSPDVEPVNGRFIESFAFQVVVMERTTS